MEDLETEPKRETEEKIKTVKVKDTEIGWLNVRQGSGTDFEVVKKIYPDEKFCPECAKDEVEAQLIIRKDFHNSSKEVAYCSVCKKMFNIAKISRN